MGGKIYIFRVGGLMNVSLERYKRRIEKARRTKVSYMNNAKWRKLFNAIEASGQCTFPAQVKTIDGERTYPFSTSPGIYEARDYTMDGKFCPIAFQDIEWLYIPATSEVERYNRNERLESKIIKYDISKLKNLLDGLGKFEYEYDENGLKLFGYR